MSIKVTAIVMVFAKTKDQMSLYHPHSYFNSLSQKFHTNFELMF